MELNVAAKSNKYHPNPQSSKSSTLYWPLSINILSNLRSERMRPKRSDDCPNVFNLCCIILETSSNNSYLSGVIAGPSCHFPHLGFFPSIVSTSQVDRLISFKSGLF